MKKFGSLALAALMVTALSISASAASSIEAAAGTAEIDGEKDDIYVCDPIDINIDETTGAVNTDNATGKAWVAWDDDYIYTYIEVTDSTVTAAANVTNIWQNDSIEFYLNVSGTEGAITDIDAAQYTYGPSFTTFAGGGKHRDDNMANAKSAYTYTDYGYTVELAIPWGANYTPAADDVITGGFGIDDDTDGDASTREFHLFSGDGLGTAWQTADANWDTITLTTKKYEPPVEVTEDTTGGETAAQTADMGIIAAVASLAASGAAVLSLKKRK